jgi:endonuclease YncB( thermonuclease family)
VEIEDFVQPGDLIREAATRLSSSKSSGVPMTTDLQTRREIATRIYLRNRRIRRSIVFATFALLFASALMARSGDDWARFNHQSFRVTSVASGDSLEISTAGGKPEVIHLLGIVGTDQSRTWLANQIVGRDVTLLLQSPQTRGVDGELRAFAWFDNRNISVELVKQGLAYADRREKSEMDGTIDPAESEARKKKLGLWANLQFEQMPAWRQAWLRSFPKRQMQQ